ncbi:phosphoglucosamine mutase [Haloarcula nitratireducens]|uniref:Phosphoglucosamine mutase n=1 Tax=Haloarcula nitratireducens TaxID=2487749 RepID=A0AAW4PEH0_9EURY|nr:phosphoglucosamine mutase [Halomicroarcula nitratireducens]MBX0296036.1 phosphoglucosamine mutase [Halomicroarcula nitratireducens]
MHVFGSSGVRGVAGKELTPRYVLQVAEGAGSVWAGEYGRVAVARDTRITGRTYANAMTSGLTGAGFDVDRLGVVPMPALQAYCDREGVPGVMITASHNPPAYNGIKLVGPDGVEFSRGLLNRVEAAMAEDSTQAAWEQVGVDRDVEDARQFYREEVREAVDRERIAEADLTVVVDPGHGAGSLTSPDLFRELGCTVHTINAQPDGHFPGRDPEPVEANLGDLRAYVESTDADLGIAHDGDADRAMFVDSEGEHVEGDEVLAALAAAELDPGEGVVSAVNASQRLVDVVEDVGAELSLTPIGSTHIVSRIHDLEAEGTHVSIAGEGNGGILFPEYRIARDGAYTAARFCELVAEAPARELVAPYADYYNDRRNLHIETESEREAMLASIEAYADTVDADLDTTDGWRLDFGDGWVLARPSGTEPLVRVYAEARTAERAAELAERMVEAAKADL